VQKSELPVRSPTLQQLKPRAPQRVWRWGHASPRPFPDIAGFAKAMPQQHVQGPQQQRNSAQKVVCGLAPSLSAISRFTAYQASVRRTMTLWANHNRKPRTICASDPRKARLLPLKFVIVLRAFSPCMQMNDLSERAKSPLVPVIREIGIFVAFARFFTVSSVLLHYQLRFRCWSDVNVASTLPHRAI